MCSQRRTQRSAGVACSRLNPDPVEGAIAKHLAVGDAVEGDAPRKAQVALPGIPGDRARQFEHDLIGNLLDRGSEIHVPLRQRFGRQAGGPSEELCELRVRHAQVGAVVEVILIEAKRTVILDVDEVRVDEIGVARPAIRRQPHHLVFARVHLEARVVGECRIQQSQGMGKVDFALDFELIAAADRQRRCCPFADAVEGQHRGGCERRGKERARRVTHVVLAEQQFRRPVLVWVEQPQLLFQQAFQEQFLVQPDRKRSAKRSKAPRRKSEVRLEQTLELQKRLVVERDVIRIPARDPALSQAIAKRIDRKARIVLLSSESLFLGRCNDLAVSQKAGRAIVVVGGDAEDMHTSEDRIEEWRQRGTLREYDQPTQKRHENEDGDQPILLADPEVLPQLTDECDHPRSELPFHLFVGTPGWRPLNPIGGRLRIGAKLERILAQHAKQ